MITFAFDVYGTLIDTSGVTGALQKMLRAKKKAADFADHWRQKQLEHTFRYGLMAHYRNFRVCTRLALDYCCAAYGAKLSEEQRDELMTAYLQLPAFDDAVAGLQQLKDAGAKMFAFSNGVPADLEDLLTQAGLLEFFVDVVSVDEVNTFKPSIAVYRHFLRRADDMEPSEAWLISGNAFDIAGARAAGWHALWLRRNPKAPDWAAEAEERFAPDKEVASFAEATEFLLPQIVERYVPQEKKEEEEEEDEGIDGNIRDDLREALRDDRDKRGGRNWKGGRGGKGGKGGKNWKGGKSKNRRGGNF